METTKTDPKDLNELIRGVASKRLAVEKLDEELAEKEKALEELQKLQNEIATKKRARIEYERECEDSQAVLELVLQEKIDQAKKDLQNESGDSSDEDDEDLFGGSKRGRMVAKKKKKKKRKTGRVVL